MVVFVAAQKSSRQEDMTLELIMHSLAAFGKDTMADNPTDSLIKTRG